MGKTHLFTWISELLIVSYIRSILALFFLIFTIQNQSFEALSQINEAFRELPHNSNIIYFNENSYLKQNRCENSVDLSSEVDELPLDVQIKNIETEQSSFSTINILLGRLKFSKKAWKKKPLLE